MDLICVLRLNGVPDVSIVSHYMKDNNIRVDILI